VLQRKTEATVSLVNRNDDGVDANTLPLILDPDQLKGGRIFCPTFVNTKYSASVSWLLKSAVPDSTYGASLAGHFRFCVLRPRDCAVSVPRHYSASLW